MAYRVGCALSDHVAAIAPVAAPNPGCRPPQPVSLIVIHGLADHQVLFANAQRWVAAWRTFDGCPTDSRTGVVRGRAFRGTSSRLVVDRVPSLHAAGGGERFARSWDPE